MKNIMEDNNDILNVLEQHWERMDGIAERSRVRIVRWRLPESRHRWVRSIAAAVVAAAAVAALIVTTVPQPDGLYANNLSHRSEAIETINQMRMTAL